MGTEANQTEKVVRTLSGRVVSDKMDKTVTVLVERKVKHPLIGKVVRRSKKFHAHNENNEAREGDLVVIVESRPLSKTKTWSVSKIVEKASPV
jgi:small subunit ribosomal protein S17